VRRTSRLIEGFIGVAVPVMEVTSGSPVMERLCFILPATQLPWPEGRASRPVAVAVPAGPGLRHVAQRPIGRCGMILEAIPAIAAVTVGVMRAVTENQAPAICRCAVVV
jgi:hypothetical protein